MPGMNIDAIIADLDAEIARLTAARDALTGSNGTGRKKREPNRRAWSAAARARQSKAMKARWAKRNAKSS
jgi:hypothetical protein